MKNILKLAALYTMLISSMSISATTDKTMLKSNNEPTALMYAMQFNETHLYASQKIILADVQKALKNNPADLNTTYNGLTPLAWAAKFGYDAVIKTLIDAGADINATHNGNTVLMLAIKAEGEAYRRRGNYEASIIALINAGAKLDHAIITAQSTIQAKESDINYYQNLGYVAEYINQLKNGVKSVQRILDFLTICNTCQSTEKCKIEAPYLGYVGLAKTYAVCKKK
jgi:hypothetical protein